MIDKSGNPDRLECRVMERGGQSGDEKQSFNPFIFRGLFPSVFLLFAERWRNHGKQWNI